MSNKSIVVYLIFGVILGLAGTLAYIMVFHDMAWTRWPRPKGNRFMAKGWLTEDPPGFPTIDMSKIYRPPDLTPVTPNSRMNIMRSISQLLVLQWRPLRR